jgi:hypothetical protein
MRQASWLSISVAALVASALAISDGAPAAAAEPMLDRLQPAAQQPADAPGPTPVAPQQPAPFAARANSVRPGGMTIDLSGREQPLNAVVDADGKVRVRCGDAPGGE